jgi:8-oxo-dGTP pyrophosphatase MutT (NUDIX family)
VIREAASIILLRRIAVGAGFEVFLVRRHRGSSFMASAFVFPGGAAEEGEDARTAAARELFEEAGVLLAKQSENRDSETLELMSQAAMRKDVLEGSPLSSVLMAAGLELATENLVPWSHWITPSIESKRFSARFFVCELPGGQKPKFDGDETVEEAWVSPADAIARAGELSLPPPQLRTMYELASLSSVQDVLAAAKVRAEEPHPILPRLRTMQAGDNGPTLLLPWDPEYAEHGTGESAPLTYVPSWATGPSRFVFDAARAWRHIAAPS